MLFSLISGMLMGFSIALKGSPAVSTYYGVRRSVMADMGLQNSKQMPGDVYPSPLIAKPFAYETPTVQGYPSLLDSYFIDQYGDHRATSIASGATSLFSTSALSSGLPSHPTDSTHFFTVSSNCYDCLPGIDLQASSHPLRPFTLGAEMLYCSSALHCNTDWVPCKGSELNPYNDPTQNSERAHGHNVQMPLI